MIWHEAIGEYRDVSFLDTLLESAEKEKVVVPPEEDALLFITTVVDVVVLTRLKRHFPHLILLRS